ncbi:hypothetical protein AGMMS49983_21060 [Clostridia bacterium]|nr:hypothetical protein AGMMS49983_21060 [Clostridia bacterium]
MKKAGFNDLEYIEVHKDQKESIDLLIRFYHELFVPSFPNENERESLENILYYIENSSNDFNDLLSRTLIFTDVENRVVAGIIFDYFEEIRAYAIEFIVVDKNFQGKGIASKVNELAVSMITEQYKKELEWLVIEIENPKKVTNGDFSYLYFWKKQHMKLVDFEYIQPALSGNKEPVTTLLLCVKNLRNNSVRTIHKKLIERFVDLYAKHAIGIARPDLDPTVSAMCRQLRAIEGDDIALLEIQGENEA